MDCKTLVAGLSGFDCKRQAVAGTTGRAVIINHGDIDKTLSTVVNNVVTDIVLKANTSGYNFETVNDAILGAVSLNKGTYVDTWQHDVTPRVFVKTEKAKQFVNSLKDGLFVVIVVNKEDGKDGDTKVEIYGWDSGLELNESTNDTSFPDGTVYVMTLGNNDTAKESSLPKSLFVGGSIATTMIALDALVIDYNDSVTPNGATLLSKSEIDARTALYMEGSDPLFTSTRSTAYISGMQPTALTPVTGQFPRLTADSKVVGRFVAPQGGYNIQLSMIANVTSAVGVYTPAVEMYIGGVQIGATFSCAREDNGLLVTPQSGFVLSQASDTIIEFRASGNVAVTDVFITGVYIKR